MPSHSATCKPSGNCALSFERCCRPRLYFAGYGAISASRCLPIRCPEEGSRGMARGVQRLQNSPIAGLRIVAGRDP